MRYTYNIAASFLSRHRLGYRTRNCLLAGYPRPGIWHRLDTYPCFSLSGISKVTALPGIINKLSVFPLTTWE